MSTRAWKHYGEVTPREWPYRYFKPSELACKGTGRLLVHDPSVLLLDQLREEFREALVVASGYRSPEYNREVNGAAKSQHLRGRAFDLLTRSTHDAIELFCRASRLGFTGFGYYARRGFIHIDTGPFRVWVND